MVWRRLLVSRSAAQKRGADWWKSLVVAETVQVTEWKERPRIEP